MNRKVIVIIILLLVNFANIVSPEVKRSSINLDFIKDSKEVLATYYNAVPNQCSGNHLITADGSRINKSKLKSGKIRWVAVSRDLRSKYKYGSKIYVYSSNKNLRGVWEVHDTMSKKYKNRIDFLFHESEKNPIIKPEKILIKKI